MADEISNLYLDKEDDYFSQVRSEINDLLPNYSEKILDIGCGDGATLEWIKTSKRCGKTYGIEISESSYLKAKKILDETLNINIEKEKNFFMEKKFDLILVLDVIEHLLDPWKFLNLIKSRLNEGGSIIISVPNIRHYSILKDLIFFGNWEYSQSGILDRTHLRFFTKKNLKKMFEKEKLNIEMLKKYPIDYSGTAKMLNKISFNLFSDFLTQQYIFKLKNADIQIK